MRTIDRVPAGCDKAPLCWLGGKDNRMVICTVFIFEIKGPVVSPHLGNKQECQISGFDWPRVMILLPSGGEKKKKKKEATFWDLWVPPPFFSPLSLSTVAFYCHMGVSSWTTDLGLSKSYSCLAWATEDWKTLTKPSHSALSYWTLKTRWKNTNPGKYKRQARIFSLNMNKNEGSVNPH